MKSAITPIVKYWPYLFFSAIYELSNVFRLTRSKGSHKIREKLLVRLEKTERAAYIPGGEMYAALPFHGGKPRCLMKFRKHAACGT